MAGMTQWLVIVKIKKLLREWLEIPYPHQPSPPSYEQKLAVAYDDIFCAVSDLKLMLIDYQQRFDLLADKLGVVIIGPTNGEGPKVVSVREDGMLGNAKTYINASQAADMFVNLYYRCMQDQVKLFGELNLARSNVGSADTVATSRMMPRRYSK